MHVQCEICQELITATEDVQVTRCGHLFHFSCISEWLNRSETCPHCRDCCNQNELMKIFFTCINEEQVHLEKNCNAENFRENLEIANASVQTLKIDLDILTEKNHELNSKLETFKEFHQKTTDELRYKKQDLEQRLDWSIEEVEKKIKEIDELNKKLESLQDLIDINTVTSAEDSDKSNESILALQKRCRKLEKELRSARNETTQLKYIQKALIEQNINDVNKILSNAVIDKKKEKNLRRRQKSKEKSDAQKNFIKTSEKKDSTKEIKSIATVSKECETIDRDKLSIDKILEIPDSLLNEIAEYIKTKSVQKGKFGSS